MVNLIDKEVEHKSFGKGSIVDQDDSFITINFETESKKFVYPDAFGKFLTLKDREAAETLKVVITEIEDEKARLEEEAEKEREIQILEQKRRDEHKKLMKNHKLHPSSQFVFWLDEEDQNVFTDWEVYTGEIKSGKNEGQPNKPVRLHQNSAVVLTERDADQDEGERRVLGLYMVSETFIGKLSEDGIVPSHAKFKLKLTEEESEQILFWNYYINEKYPHRMTWNTGKYRYFDNIWTAQMLRDIAGLKKDPEEAKLAEEFFVHFCKMNLIDIDELPQPSGALLQ